jgi:hypothetical protein
MSSESQEYSIAELDVNAEVSTPVVHYGAAMKMRMLILLLAFTASIASAEDRNFKPTLKLQYEQRLLVLRSPLQQGTRSLIPPADLLKRRLEISGRFMDPSLCES